MKNYELMQELLKYPAGATIMVERSSEYDVVKGRICSLSEVICSEQDSIIDDDGNEYEKIIALLLESNEKIEKVIASSFIQEQADNTHC